MENKNIKKNKKRGAPARVKWSSFNLQWKNKTDSEIALAAGCSIVNVFLRRKRLIAKSIAEGKDGSFYTCTRAKWSRGKHVKQKVSAVESAPVAEIAAVK